MIYASHVEHAFEVHNIELSDCVLLGENERTLRCFENSSLDVHITDDVATYHATDVRKEIVSHGWSSRLAADLSNKEINRIIRTERIKEHIGNNGHVIHDGHVHMIQQPYKERLYDVVVSPDAVVIMYIDENDHIWFCRQYRVPVRKELLELPAETIDKPGKSPLEHAVEGLAEECGVAISPSQVESVGVIGSSEGHDTEHVHLFIARGPHTYVGQQLCGGEEINVERVAFSDAYEKMLTGEITGSKSRILLQHEHIRRLKGGRNGIEY
jgi:ADP-ribose pyrophosphatase